MTSLCKSCINIDGLYRSCDLTMALHLGHVNCIKYLIGIGVPVSYNDANRYASFHDMELLDFVCVHIIHPIRQKNFIDKLWRFAIDHYNCEIMMFMASKNTCFYLDIYYATREGHLESLQFLIENMGRVPTNETVEVAIQYGHVKILKYLYSYSIFHHLERIMWNGDCLFHAIKCAQLDCLKYLLTTDSVVWKSAIVFRVYDWWQRLPTLKASYDDYILPTQNRMLVCLRYVHDYGFSWPSTICGDLCEDCVLKNCVPCTRSQISFNFVYDIILERFKRRKSELDKLIISFANIFQKCDNCGRIEML